MNLDGYKELISFSWWQHWLLFIKSLAVWVSAPRQMMQTVEFLRSKEKLSRRQTKMNSRDAWTTKHPSKDNVNPLTMLRFMVLYLPQMHEVNRVIIYDIPLQERRVTWVRSVFGHCCHSTRAPSWVTGTLMRMSVWDVHPTVHASCIHLYWCTRMNSIHMRLWKYGAGIQHAENKLQD